MDFNMTLLSGFLPPVLTAYLHLSRGFIHGHPAIVTGCCATALAHLGLIFWDYLVYPDLAPIFLPALIATSYTILLATLAMRLIRKHARSLKSA